MLEASFPDATEEQIQEGKGLAWLSYFGILFLIPLLIQNDNPYTKHHVIQGVILFIVGLLPFWILSFLYYRMISFAIFLLGLLNLFVCLVIFVFVIIGIIKAATGKFWRVPFIGEIGEDILKGMFS